MIDCSTKDFVLIRSVRFEIQNRQSGKNNSDISCARIPSTSFWLSVKPFQTICRYLFQQTWWLRKVFDVLIFHYKFLCAYSILLYSNLAVSRGFLVFCTCAPFFNKFSLAPLANKHFETLVHSLTHVATQQEFRK